MKRLISGFLLLCLIFFYFPIKNQVFGVDCSNPDKIFSSVYNVAFSFDSKGKAQVSQKVSLKNLVDGCFASEYSLSINSANVTNVSGKDTLGKMNTSVKKSKSSSTISAKLNDEVIGRNRSVTFQVNYQIAGLAKKKGLSWEVVVPSVNTSEKVTNYNLTIRTPDSYGKVFSVQPPPSKTTKEGKSNILAFDETSALEKNILASFGTKQQISFALKVPLENNRLFPRTFTILLPPDTNNQKVLLTKLSVQPTEFIEDTLGNLYAKYDLKNGKKLEVQVQGVVTITSAAETFSISDNLGTSESEKYKKGGKYIEVNDLLVQQKAKELVDLKSIYDFVVKFLKFDTKALEVGKSERKTVSTLLKGDTLTTNQGFVDLFAALAKAAGLPTRLVYGFVVSDAASFRPTFVGEPLETDKLSVWVQVYDKNEEKWISIDPTIGHTLGIDYIQTGFLDRVTLFYSANGDDLKALKNISETSENIKSAFVSTESHPKPSVLLKIESDQVFSGFPVEVKVILENKTGLTLHNGLLKIESQGIVLVGKPEIKIGEIFPFEKKEVRFKLRSGNLFNDESEMVKLKLIGNSGLDKISEASEAKILIKSFFSFGIQQGLLLLILVLICTGIFAPRVLRSKK